MRHRLETLLNVGTIALVLTGMVLLGYKYQQASSRIEPVRGRIEANVGIDFKRSSRTLILVLQQDCGFCAASMPFYRTLMDRRSQRAAPLQVAVAAPKRDASIGDYLAQEGLVVDAIVHVARASDLPVRMTPTLFVVDRDGKIVATWEGALASKEQEAVISYLFSGG